MKVAFVLFALLGIACGASVKVQDSSEILTRDPLVVKHLSADLEEFLALIPIDQIVAILQKYLADPEFQMVMYFLFSPQFHDLYLTMHEIEEYKEFRYYLIQQGIEMDRYDQTIREFLGIPFSPATVASRNDLGGVNGFLWEVIGVLPLDEIRALAVYKLDNSPAFYELFQYLRSEHFQDIVRALRADPTYQFIVEYLEIFGINVDAIVIVIITIFGWDL